MTQLESALHILAVDPFDEAAPADLADVPLSNLDLPRLMALAVEAVQ